MKLKVKEFIDEVLNDKRPHCKYVKQAVNRHLSDMKTGKRRGLYFDEEAARHAVEFCKFLKHSKGEWAGQVFDPEPWEQFILWNIFGWKKKDKSRRFKIVYLEVPRKNGKSTFCAVIGDYLFIADGEAGAEIYAAATKRDQALITFSEATRMVKSSPMLKKIVTIVRNNMSIMKTASKFEPLGADADTLDGLNPHGAIIDELHAHKTRNLWDVMITAVGARLQPLIFAITTAGFNKNSICWEQHAHLAKILDGVIEDDSFFGMIFTIDEGDDWFAEKTWEKANPNYGKSVKADDMRELAARAREMPSQLNAFLRLKLNVWTEAETRWFTQEIWNSCAGSVDADALKGKLVWSGMDLSSSIDVTALVHVIQVEDHFKILWRFFIPQENIEKRVRKDRVPYDVWVREGYITATPGNVIDYNYIFQQIDEDAQRFDIKEIAYDRWGATKIAPELAERGLTVVPFGQGFASMSPACKDFERLLMSKKIEHGNNPVANWMASNVVIKEDEAGNIKPDKGKSTEKIDGIVALVMAIDRALRNKDDKSVYDEGGIFIV